MGIPRGGVVIADIIAKKLGCQFDIVIPRKLRAPDNEELAIGAVMEDGTTYLNDDIVRTLGISEQMSAQRTRLTTEQSEVVKEIVLSGILANRTVNETINIIDRRLGIKLAIDTIKHLRMKVRKEVFDELQIMKTDNETYIYVYLKNIEQTKSNLELGRFGFTG